MAKKTIKQVELPVAPKVKYDPKRQWQWKPDDKIEFTGIEFHKLNQILSEYIVSDINVPMILKLAEAFALVQGKMSEYVDKGIIVPMPEQAKSE